MGGGAGWAQTVTLLPETVALLLKTLKTPEVQLRVEATLAVGRAVAGAGRAASEQVLKEVFKTVRGLLSDKAGAVQLAALEVRLLPRCGRALACTPTGADDAACPPVPTGLWLAARSRCKRSSKAARSS